MVGMERGETPLNIFATLARNPELMTRANRLGGRLLWRSSLPGRAREIMILRTAWRSGSEYEFGQHRVIGIEAGLSEEEVSKLAEDEIGARWTAEESSLIALTDELCTTNTVSAEAWAAAMEGRDDRQKIELLLLVGFYRMLAGFLNAAGVALEADVSGWPVAP
jgi:4-carboxymuconolactone decarboxylase